jgi:hypothetical protein
VRNYEYVHFADSDAGELASQDCGSSPSWL